MKKATLVSRWAGRCKLRGIRLRFVNVDMQRYVGRQSVGNEYTIHSCSKHLDSYAAQHNTIPAIHTASHHNYVQFGLCLVSCLMLSVVFYITNSKLKDILQKCGLKNPGYKTGKSKALPKTIQHYTIPKYIKKNSITTNKTKALRLKGQKVQRLKV